MASIQSKKSKSGRVAYYVVVSIHGKHKWIRAGTLKDARILKKDIEALEESERREKLGVSKIHKKADQAFQEYLDHVRLRCAPNTVKRYRAALNAFLAFLRLYCPRIRHLSQVKPEHIELYQDKRLTSTELKVEADGDKNGNHKTKRLPLPQTVNYEVSVLRSAFVWALEREWMSTVPTRRVKKLKAREKRQARILSTEECSLLLRVAGEMAAKGAIAIVYCHTFEFLLNTGLRAGELCNLTWDDVNSKSGLIQIREKPGWSPKTYARDFFLNERSLELLREISVGKDYVFTSPSGKQLGTDNLRRALIKVARKAEIGGLTRVHDLRHTFNSLMQMNGVDAPTMASILGHKDLSTTMIYTHQTKKHLKNSIEKVGIGH
ncbi:MAG: tyrosine-type recombinase/integrase [Proteobacteria bacterium]|nr:tyrosine-type recombinase/integrase [Pseudomonadota bacterium]